MPSSPRSSSGAATLGAGLTVCPAGTGTLRPRQRTCAGVGLAGPSSQLSKTCSAKVAVEGQRIVNAQLAHKKKARDIDK